MANVLVTGGTGFLGSALVRRLARAGDRVLVLVREGSETRRLAPVQERVELLRCDVGEVGTWEPKVRRFAPERVFHLAWYAEPGKYLTDVGKNLLHLALGSMFVERVLQMRPSQFVVTGTCYEYDTRAGYLREDVTPEAPGHIYSACKLALKHVALRLAADANVPLVWARIFYLFGPYEDPRRLVPLITAAARSGRPLRLKTHGLQVRDYLHVDDVAAGLDHAARLGRPGVVNVGSGEPVRVREFARDVAKAVGRDDVLSFAHEDTLLDEPPFVCADSSRLRSLGWKPTVTKLDAHALRAEDGA
jgi:nucleoside-diphosphate-sugar epimerase